ncbi:hypothetical protein [uncultured Gemmiger sp.]|mgnify:CR=1 FL=1|uniref:hypothetical protein n=1 Tax=uncultured Gemmiger sp. TaxID=1623490 RepID=UPI0025CF66FC|nr:hypothetical protein [uncultured Gemmiger sp.]
MAKFNKGDKVRFVETPEAMREHCRAPQFYPLPGTVGTACENMIPRGEVQVQWPYGSVKGPDFVWRVPSELLEPVENTVPDYYIRVTATSEHDAQVEVNGPANWVHEALAQAIMKLNPDDPLGVLASIAARALMTEEENDGTE